VENSVLSATTVVSNAGREATYERFSFPITVNFVYPVAGSTFGFTVVTSQHYQDSKLTLLNGHLRGYTLVTNSAHASDENTPSSWQDYTVVNLKGKSYDCEIASSDNVLTSVSKGCD
jgi:hypothetical protein